MNTMPGKEMTPFVLYHEFHAPRKEVFNAFSEADALNEWWGPVECRNTVIKLDFRPGGLFHFKMDFNGHISYGRFLFGRIERYDLLEFNNAFADENANAIPAPFDIKIPREIFYRLEFSEKAGKTILKLTGIPVNAQPEEEKGFISIRESMQQGFASTFDKLREYLSGLQS